MQPLKELPLWSLRPAENREHAAPSVKTDLGGLSVKQVPIVTFDGDQVIGSGQVVTINVFERMGGRCTGFVLVSVVPGVQVSINNGGFRTIPSDVAYNDINLKTIAISTDAVGSCILQLHGV